MNVLFSILLILAVFFSLVTGRTEAFTKGIFEGAAAAVEISIMLLGVVSLWMGILKMLEDAGFVGKISKFAEPIVGKVFKNIPRGHPAISSITMNILANIFGLGNAATPIGIKAMKDLEKLSALPENINPSGISDEKKGTDKEISFEMMLFIVINTASIQLIPFTVVGILSRYGSAAPQLIILPTIIATILSAVCAVGILLVARKIEKISKEKFPPRK